MELSAKEWIGQEVRDKRTFMNIRKKSWREHRSLRNTTINRDSKEAVAVHDRKGSCGGDCKERGRGQKKVVWK